MISHRNRRLSVLRNRSLLDCCSIGLSGVCLVHCLLTPVVVILYPVVSIWRYEHGFHLVMFIVLLSVGGLAFWTGFRRHHRPKVLGLALVGFVLLGWGAFQTHHLGHGHTLPTDSARPPFLDYFASLGFFLTVSGGIVLVVAHVLNIRFGNQLNCPNRMTARSGPISLNGQKDGSRADL